MENHNTIGFAIKSHQVSFRIILDVDQCNSSTSNLLGLISLQKIMFKSFGIVQQFHIENIPGRLYIKVICYFMHISSRAASFSCVSIFKVTLIRRLRDHVHLWMLFRWWGSSQYDTMVGRCSCICSCVYIYTYIYILYRQRNDMINHEHIWSCVGTEPRPLQVNWTSKLFMKCVSSLIVTRGLLPK